MTKEELDERINEFDNTLGDALKAALFDGGDSARPGELLRLGVKQLISDCIDAVLPVMEKPDSIKKLEGVQNRAWNRAIQYAQERKQELGL